MLARVKPVSLSLSIFRTLSTSSMSAAAGKSAESGPIELCIRSKIQDALKPVFLDMANDSWKHAHHAGIRGATNVTESHFNVTIVSDEFEGKNLPARHRLVYKLLEEELNEKGVHALQLKTKTPREWEKA
ncbi:unnamed protein product [Kuraishia capsulata CBS 1993]|uniref:BolA protein n=1 Tax=Kuraishia capsulata CBS 1993 TaxID=1382522 RepID=W6MRI5_9ASCO|nr:uncharacterized protein KUCA_T00003836001 [Kuraishia capsulata CBS 1993]CDK27857.1 unnamed protein product [Kuraishia capsulata CBS 1993]